MLLSSYKDGEPLMSPINFYKGYYAILTTVTINKTPEQFSTWNSVAKSAVFENKTEESPTEQRRLHYNICIRTYTSMYVCTYVWKILYIHTYSTYVRMYMYVRTYLRMYTLGQFGAGECYSKVCMCMHACKVISTVESICMYICM